MNTGNEAQKNGLEITKTKEFVKWCVSENKLNIIGLMCIPPVEENSSIHFKILRSLANECNLNNLSMGMSVDFAEAIKNGATHVRIDLEYLGRGLNQQLKKILEKYVSISQLKFLFLQQYTLQ